jgi:hypothetical protein
VNVHTLEKKKKKKKKKKSKRNAYRVVGGPGGPITFGSETIKRHI